MMRFIFYFTLFYDINKNYYFEKITLFHFYVMNDDEYVFLFV